MGVLFCVVRILSRLPAKTDNVLRWYLVVGGVVWVQRPVLLLGRFVLQYWSFYSPGCPLYCRWHRWGSPAWYWDTIEETTTFGVRALG